MDKLIDNLIKDISKYTGEKYQDNLDYIKRCLNIAYLKGSVEASDRTSKFYTSLYNLKGVKK